MMKELDIMVYSSASSSLDLSSKPDLENELVCKALDEDVIYKKEDLNTDQTINNTIMVNSDMTSNENETYCNTILKDFCLNFWRNKTNKLKLHADIDPKQKDSNETLKSSNKTNKTKRLLKVEEEMRKRIFSLDAWSLENSNQSLERNFSNLSESMQASYDHDSNRNDALNQTLNLLKKTHSLTTISTLNSRDELSLKRALSDICKTQRLSQISTVTGSFSLKLNEEDKELVPVYITKH